MWNDVRHIDWKGINWAISSVVGLLGALAISVVANLVTPGVKDFLARRSIAKVKKRIQELEEEVHRLNTQTFQHVWAFGYRSILRTLILFLCGSLITRLAFGIVADSVAAAFYLVAAVRALRDYALLRPYDDSYRNSLRQRIEALRRSLPSQERTDDTPGTDARGEHG